MEIPPQSQVLANLKRSSRLMMENFPSIVSKFKLKMWLLTYPQILK